MDSTNAILLYGYCWDEEDLASTWEAARDDTDVTERQEHRCPN